MHERRPPSARWQLRRCLPCLALTALLAILSTGCDPTAPVQKASPPQPKSLFKEIPMGERNVSPR